MMRCGRSVAASLLEIPRGLMDDGVSDEIRLLSVLRDPCCDSRLKAASVESACRRFAKSEIVDCAHFEASDGGRMVARVRVDR